MASTVNPPTGRRTRTTTKRGGGGWLVLFLLVGGVGAVFVFAPQIPRQLFGMAPPAKDGEPPRVAQEAKTSLNERDHAADSKLSAPTTVDRSNNAAPKGPTTPAAPIKPVAPTYADESQAQTFLTDAEKAYKGFEWQKAVSKASQIEALNAKPTTKVRAKDITRGASALEKLFVELADKDELTRAYDTDPSLVTITMGGSPSFAVPIRSMEDQTVVADKPLDWIASQRKAGKITVLLKGKNAFSAASLTPDAVGEVAAADLDAIRKDKTSDFTSRLERLKNGDMATNPLAWYDAAKFAYRNRLDDQVTEMMDRAVVLDPMLVKSVREDKAASLLANVVLHMKNGNTKQAAAFMAIINKRFADTDSGREAKLYYEGKTADLATARREMEKRRIDDERQRQEARIARAKEMGDDKALAAIQKEKTDSDATAMKAPATSGDEGAADAMFDKGKDLYSKAIDAGNSDARDQLYAQALREFTQAQNIYNSLLEKNPSNGALEEKAFMCNKLRYGARKQQRFH